MTCSKCQGLMVPIPPLVYLQRSDGPIFIDLELPAHRCLTCGNVQDPVVIRNRWRQAHGLEAA